MILDGVERVKDTLGMGIMWINYSQIKLLWRRSLVQLYISSFPENVCGTIAPLVLFCPIVLIMGSDGFMDV